MLKASISAKFTLWGTSSQMQMPFFCMLHTNVIIDTSYKLRTRRIVQIVGQLVVQIAGTCMSIRIQISILEMHTSTCPQGRNNIAYIDKLIRAQLCMNCKELTKNAIIMQVISVTVHRIPTVNNCDTAVTTPVV